jgi:hypothetical protein
MSVITRVKSGCSVDHVVGTVDFIRNIVVGKRWKGKTCERIFRFYVFSMRVELVMARKEGRYDLLNHPLLIKD